MYNHRFYISNWVLSILSSQTTLSRQLYLYDKRTKKAPLILSWNQVTSIKAPSQNNQITMGSNRTDILCSSISLPVPPDVIETFRKSVRGTQLVPLGDDDRLWGNRTRIECMGYSILQSGQPNPNLSCPL